MPKENISQELMKKQEETRTIEETRNYFIKEIDQNE